MEHVGAPVAACVGEGDVHVILIACHVHAPEAESGEVRGADRLFQCPGTGEGAGRGCGDG